MPRSTRDRIRNHSWMLLLGAFLLLASGCATTRTPSSFTTTPVRHRGETISVGDFRNNTGFSNPRQIRFNVTLDSPVSELIRRVVVAELERDGYTIGNSIHEVSGTVNSVVYGKDGTSISFTLKHTTSGRVLYEKTFHKGSGGMFIYNSSGQIDQMRSCVRDFVADLAPRLAELRTPSPVAPVQTTQLVADEPRKRPSQPAAVTCATSPRPGVGRRWALVVGISEYDDSRIAGLRYAARDAQAFHDWLVSPAGGRYAPANVRLLLNKDATATRLRSALFTWLKKALAEDMVVVYFDGHGSPDSLDSPDNLFLLTHDTQYDDIPSTAFPMWDLNTALKRFIKAGKVVLIADACHSAGVGQPFDIARRSGRGLRVTPVNSGLQSLSELSDGICVLTAADANQLSQEGAQWGGGHGVFTYYLLDGLNGSADYNKDKNVTLGELIPFLSEKVRRATSNSQSPTVAGKFDPAIPIAK